MLDVFYRSLADRRRRLILSFLLDGSAKSMTSDELVDRIMQSEPHSVSSDRKSIAVDLYHQHLPLLAEQGLIDYESDRGTVRKTDRTEQVEPLLSVVEGLDGRPGFDHQVAESRR